MTGSDPTENYISPVLCTRMHSGSTCSTVEASNDGARSAQRERQREKAEKRAERHKTTSRVLKWLKDRLPQTTQKDETVTGSPSQSETTQARSHAAEPRTGTTSTEFLLDTTQNEVEGPLETESYRSGTRSSQVSPRGGDSSGI